MRSYRLFIFVLLATAVCPVHAQVITGNVVCKTSGEPIEYVNIGIVETAVGTITNETGNYNLDVIGLPVDSKVRFSMVGFQAQTYTIEELMSNPRSIAMEEQLYNIAEVIVKPRGIIRKAGTTKYSKGGGVCGWGGTQFGSGHELGVKIDLGNAPVRLKSIHVKLYKQSFDSTLFRLHIRDIVADLPKNELLKENIIINVSDESGWVEFDLGQYDIILNGIISLSLEWLKVYGINENRLVRMDESKIPRPVVLFNIRRNAGVLYVRKGSEAKWSKDDSKSPAFYLTVIE